MKTKYLYNGDIYNDLEELEEVLEDSAYRLFRYLNEEAIERFIAEQLKFATEIKE